MPAYGQDSQTVEASVEAQTMTDSVPPAADPLDQLSLQAILENGGAILWAILALGFCTIVLAAYLFMTVNPKREAPQQLTKRVANQIRAGEIREAAQMCNEGDELLAKVLFSGLRMADEERYIIQEAMESEGERGAAELWQRISYLQNIGAIAPLLGLLGTVWGMIGAFSAIAMDNTQVKGLTMAYSVSQAMITTAAGLILAIPALVTYYFLKGRVVKIISRVESQSSEIVEILVRNNRR
jgi:biopolymer transport protein ExbB